jgi:hypothetical protein
VKEDISGRIDFAFPVFMKPGRKKQYAAPMII